LIETLRLNKSRSFCLAKTVLSHFNKFSASLEKHMTPTYLKLDGAPACLMVPSNDHVGLFLKLQNEEETRQYFVRYMPIGRKQELEWIERANTTQTDVVFTIATHPQLQPIGSIGLHRIHWKDRNASLGIGMLEKHCNNGLGTCAAMLMLSYAFTELGLNKVEWCAVGYNARSIACAKKCGAEDVGRSKRHIWRKGKWHDEVIMDIHRTAWIPLWRKFEKRMQKNMLKVSP